MSKDRKQEIINKTIHLFALQGYEGVSMRNLADEVGIASSVLYHYFSDKNVLLKEVFDETNINLGKYRATLPVLDKASDMLKQRIIFQLDHAEEIVFVLKYFLHERRNLPKFKSGYVPEKTTRHIEEVLELGQKTGEFQIKDTALDAKVITHAINGFILEYYPAKLEENEKEEIATMIHTFLMNALTKGGEKI